MLVFTRQMVQEGFHLSFANGVRVTLAMEIDALPDPGTIAILRPGAEVPLAADDGNFIE